MSIGKIITTKGCWVGFAVIGALSSSAPAFADDCDPLFFICPPPNCWGDPHCRTEDGVLYDFQGAGEFILMRDPNGLEIQTRQTPVVSGTTPSIPEAHSGLASCVSLNTAIAVRLGEHRVSYEPKWSGGPDPSPGSLELRVDGKLEPVGPSGLAYNDGSSILKTSSPGGLVITFPDKSILQVTPGWWPAYSTWYLNYEVMIPIATRASGSAGASASEAAGAGRKPGRFPRGGILGAISPGGWLPALPNGSTLGPRPSDLHGRYLALYKKFADAWRVNGKTSIFDYAPGTSTETFTTRSWPPEQGPCVIPKIKPVKLDPPATEQVATDACRDVTDEGTRKSCVFDVRVTAHLDFAKTYVAGQKIHAGLTKTTLIQDHPQTIELSPVTFTSSVTPLGGAKSTPAGAVQFWGDGKPRERIPLDPKGQAKWTSDRITAGVHSIMATYEPAEGSGFVGSSSQPVAHTVAKK